MPFPAPQALLIDYLAIKKDNEPMKLSNKFTLARALFAPVFFLLYHVPLWLNSALLLKISAFCMIPLLALFELTDYFDGYYARKRGDVSDFGKLFDPFADVILNLTVFMCALTSAFGGRYIPVIFLLLIMYREFTMLFLRLLAALRGTAIAARKGGKLKTVFYILSGFFALTADCAFRLGWRTAQEVPAIRLTAAVLFGVCVFLSYLSFVDYLIHFLPILREDFEKKT